MRLLILQLAAACTLVSTAAHGQLHVIAGAQARDGRSYALALFRIGDDGSVQSVADLVPRNEGTEFLAMSYELRQALIYGGATQVVLDLDKAAVVKRCSAPLLKGLSRVPGFVADVPGRGLTFEWTELGGPSVGGRRSGMVMDPGVPCETSFIAVQPMEDRFIVAHGTVAIGDIHCGTGTAALIDGDGNLAVGDISGDKMPWGFKIPLDLLRGLVSLPTIAAVVINDPQVMVIAPGERPRHYFALRKRDKTWHVINVQAGQWDRLRSFGGRFVAIIEARTKKPTAGGYGDVNTLDDARREIAEGNLSPGIEEWRTSFGKKNWEELPGCSKFGCESKYGPDTFQSFMNAKDFFPGRLHLFDIETEKMFTINTKQGDSEILLVEGDTVYYRVNDRLYSAPIGDTGVGMPKQIGKDDVIRDVHYAFMTH